MKEVHIPTLNDPRISAKLGAEAHSMEIIMKASLQLEICALRLLVTRLVA